MNVLQRWFRSLLSHIHYLLAAGHRHFGNQYSLTQEHQSAVEDFTKAIAYDPTFARAYLERGILYWRELDRPDRAVLDLTTAYELDPGLIEAIFNRGIAHQQLQEYAEAVDDYQAYLREGDHAYWRQYAQTMIRELVEWISGPEAGK